MSRAARRPGAASGFTLLELMIAMIIIAILASMAIPLYVRTVATAESARAIQDLKTIANAIDLYTMQHGALPASLVEVGLAQLRDPWGRPYVYAVLGGGGGNGNGGGNGGGNGHARKDHNLVPINTDYDLYSIGPDGKSASPLTAAISRDDIVRANDGAFFGVAIDY